MMRGEVVVVVVVGGGKGFTIEVVEGYELDE